MPRCYKRKLGGSKRRNYDKNIVERAVSDVRDLGMSIRESATRNNIDKSKLSRALKSKQLRASGGQTTLSANMEDMLVEKLITCASRGYPLDTLDIRLFIKWHLDSNGLNVRRFRGNMPGPDWAESFLQRNSHRLSNRFTANIKRVRAQVSPRIVHNYFDNISETLEGIPPENIYNYDETIISLIRRG